MSALSHIALQVGGGKAKAEPLQVDVQTALVIPDTHVPLHDPAAVDVVLQALAIVRPKTLIHLGDLGEWESVSAWKWKRKARPPLEYQLPELDRDFEVVGQFLDLLDSAASDAGVTEKVWLEGNHDQWVGRLLEEAPYLASTYGLQERLGLAARGWQYVQEGDFHRFGDLRLTHGSVGAMGATHTRTRAQRWGASVLYGHTHGVQSFSQGHIDGPVTVQSLGCLKKLDRQSNPWLKGSPSDWAHAFAVLHILEGKTHVQVIPIHNGRAVVYGQLLTGRE